MLFFLIHIAGVSFLVFPYFTCISEKRTLTILTNQLLGTGENRAVEIAVHNLTGERRGCQQDYKYCAEKEQPQLPAHHLVREITIEYKKGMATTGTKTRTAGPMNTAPSICSRSMLVSAVDVSKIINIVQKRSSHSCQRRLERNRDRKDIRTTGCWFSIKISFDFLPKPWR